MASVVMHVVLLGAAWLAHRAAAEPIEYLSYEMQIVSMADLEPEEEVTLAEPEDLVVETPEEEPPAPEEEPEPPPPEPDPEPEVVEEPPPPDEDPPEPDDPPEETRDEVTESPPPEETEAEPAEASAADISMRMEGLQRDFPAYYRNIVTQIRACLRWDGRSDWTTVVRFRIDRDGTVRGASIDVRERSGSATFDLAAVGAVECAGAGRFGPLPEDLPYDELPIQFTFSGAGASGGGG